MPRLSLRHLSESLRSDGDRFVDLRVALVAQDEAGNLRPDGEVLLDVGGRWDRATKQYTESGVSRVELGLHGGQLEAARWVVRWFRSKAGGEVLRERGRAIWSVLFHGGRRAGKTDLAAKAAICYAIARPRSFIWLVSESIPKTEELEANVLGWLPRDWYEHLGAPHFTFTLPNGSVIWLRSAHDPDSLKRGRCDFAVLNEAQNMPERAFATVRAATADNGGLTLLAANPPDTASGMWVERFYEQARAGKRAAREVHFDASKNPHVHRESLEDMKDDVDERTYRREVLGEFLPREDVVFYAWSPQENVRPPPDPRLKLDITREITLAHFGREFDGILGMDFQFVPFMVAVALRFYRDPGGPEPLAWYEDEIFLEQATEEDLSAALLLRGYDPKRWAIVADASGDHQDGKHIRGRQSFAVLRQCGWSFIYKPDPRMERNPDILDRVRATNGLMRNAKGRRRLFSRPELLRLNEALKMWENKGGVPFRRSKYAHACDAASYPIYRLFPRRGPVAPLEIEVVTQEERHASIIAIGDDDDED